MQQRHKNIAERQIFNQHIRDGVKSAIAVNGVNNQGISNKADQTDQHSEGDFNPDLDIASSEGVSCDFIRGIACTHVSVEKKIARFSVLALHRADK